MAVNDKTDQKAESLNLRSEDVQDLLGKPPGWLVSWGTGILFLIIIIVIAGSGFFSYPDIVRAPVIITKENPPSLLIARSPGKPEAIFHADGTAVNKNDTLAVLENSARYGDIFRLRNHIRHINDVMLSGSDISMVSIPGDLVLGEVQYSFNQLASSLYEYRIFVNQDFYEKKIAALIEEHNQYSGYRNNLERQKNLAQRDLQLGLTQFNRDSMLYISNVISIAEYERSQTLLLARHKALEASSLDISDAGITIARLERSIAETRLEKEEKHQFLLTSLGNAFRQLESSLAAWENSYLLVAPATGTLNYLSIWSSLQELKAGDPVFSIIPDDMGSLHTRIILPFSGAGKVRPGNRVNIKLDGYPYMEFGMVEGLVHSVSGAPVENGFPAVISLINGSVTTYGRELEVIRQLPGTAEISTDEISLMERLFSPVRHLVKNRLI
jgi:hypothetical protein